MPPTIHQSNAEIVAPSKSVTKIIYRLLLQSLHQPSRQSAIHPSVRPYARPGLHIPCDAQLYPGSEWFSSAVGGWMALTETPLAALAITIQKATVMRSINLARSVNGIFKRLKVSHTSHTASSIPPRDLKMVSLWQHRVTASPTTSHRTSRTAAPYHLSSVPLFSANKSKAPPLLFNLVLVLNSVTVSNKLPSRAAP